METVDELVAEARTLVAAIVRRARLQLGAGEDVGRIQRRVATAVGWLEDIEAYAIVAASGDRDALAEIERLVQALADLRDELSDLGRPRPSGLRLGLRLELARQLLAELPLAV